MTRASEFLSPLRIQRVDDFTRLRFGEVNLNPEVAALRLEFERRLSNVLALLPGPLWRECLGAVDGYGGGGGKFYHLFYPPVWSFLYWIPAVARRPIDPAMLSHATTAQALALFLHLWDDHLCDGQLPLDMARLQARCEAWRAFIVAANALRDATAPGSRRVEQQVELYLTATQRPGQAQDLEAYCERFLRQIAIWTLAPRLFGETSGQADALCATIESFSIAWRLLDDVQDIAADSAAGVRTAVWHLLDDAGRRCWDDCHAAAQERERVDDATFEALAAHAKTPSCVPALLARIDSHLAQAARIAARENWSGLFREIVQSRLPVVSRGRRLSG